MRLYKQLSFFYFQYSNIEFQLKIPIPKLSCLNFSLPFNNLSIQTFWQIGLHKAVPLRTFSRGHSVNVSVQSFK